MATAKDREEFIVLFCSEYLGKPAPKLDGRSMGKFAPLECLAAARSLLRLARAHGNLAAQHCNGPAHLNGPAPYDWQKQPEQHAAWIKRNGEAAEAWEAAREKKELAVEKRITDICAGFKLPVIFGGDPRGYTVKVKFPSGRYNTFGGAEEGWGVPQ